MWRRFGIILVSGSAGALALCWLAVLLADPLGVSPIALPLDPVLTQSNRRFMVPRVIRRGDYDSYIVGTSTLHHVPPSALDRTLGGRFANVATHGATPYEQRRILDLVLRQPGRTRSLVLGLDPVWCAEQPWPRYNPESPLPEWLYDDSTLSHIAHMLNARMMTLVGKHILVAAGLIAPNLEPSGYHSDLPDDTTWTAGVIGGRLWTTGPRAASDPDPLSIGGDGADASRFPELEMLADRLKRIPLETRMYLVMMPNHVAALPQRGTARAAALSACKARIRALAEQHGVAAVDYLKPSSITSRDENFWDHDHTRVSFADDLARDLGRVARGEGAGAGEAWAALTMGRARHAVR
jgi:hypothetical protein